MSRSQGIAALFVAFLMAVAVIFVLYKQNQHEKRIEAAVSKKMQNVVSVVETAPQDMGRLQNICVLPEEEVTPDGEHFWLKCNMDADFPTVPYHGKDVLAVTNLLAKGYPTPEITVTIEAIGRNGELFKEVQRVRPIKLHIYKAPLHGAFRIL